MFYLLIFPKFYNFDTKIMNFMLNLKRARKLNNISFTSGNILYWMQRDQRVDHNWALIYAYHLAKKYNKRLFVLFNIVDNFINAPLRHYDFMVKGLVQIDGKLKELNINFIVTYGNPVFNITNFIEKEKISLLISDFNPVKTVIHWKSEILKSIKIPFCEVDTHNIIPACEVSDKQEFAAYTIRPKIHKLLNEFLDDYPALKPMDKENLIYRENIIKVPDVVDKSVQPIEYLLPGYDEAFKKLQDFINFKLTGYNEYRNDPNLNYTSRLSAYLHFGHISSQTVVKEIIKNSNIHNISQEDLLNSFFDEIIVRKELSDNYCFYNKNYDNFDGIPSWAKDTLNQHRNDKREYTYSLEEFENAETHDDLWNAAQIQMMFEGYMHGFMRMYWAKKILEWTETPEVAIEYAIYLNDKYELDGRDPNGYVGILWAIGGLHDRAWNERAVFGKIRYMNYNGCKRKFDTLKYINK